MDRELRRAELADKIKNSFGTSNSREELELYAKFMNQVYAWQKEGGDFTFSNTDAHDTQAQQTLNQ